MRATQIYTTFVTGAAMGNGEGIAKVFLKYGATVLLADISEKEGFLISSVGSI